MQQIGIRELKNQATEIIRDVREQHAEYIITYRGRPVAIITPVSDLWTQTLVSRTQPTHNELEDEMEAIRREMAQYWPKNISAAEAVAEQRR